MTTRRWATGIVAVLTAWISVLAIVMVVSDEASEALIIFPGQDLTANLPEDISILDGGRYWIVIKGDQPDLALTAYKSGAGLVLPAGLSGCFALID